MPYNLRNQTGITLILSILLMSLILFLGIYFMAFSLIESKISRSHAKALQAYYLGEAGVQEATFKIKNDIDDYGTNFTTLPDWTENFVRDDPFGVDSGSYTVFITNSNFAHGDIFSTSALDSGEGQTSQRIVKTIVFKAIGSLTNDSPVFSGGSSENINISVSKINVYDGNLFSNNNLNVSWFSTVNVYDDPGTGGLEGKALAGGNIIESWNSTINATEECAKNVCDGNCEEGCPANAVLMPMVDFDSEDGNSYKNQAATAEAASGCSVLCNGIECNTKCVYSESDFEDLLWQVDDDGTLTLDNEITYVTGKVDIKGGRRLIVNGTLVADGTIDIGEKNCWNNGGEKDCGFNQVTVNDPGADKPSGLLTKSKLNFGVYSSFQNIQITGIIYANDEVKIISVPTNFTVTGGILGRKISITSVLSPLNIYLDNSIISEGVWGGPTPPGGAPPPFSPVVTVEHWEEEY